MPCCARPALPPCWRRSWLFRWPRPMCCASVWRAPVAVIRSRSVARRWASCATSNCWKKPSPAPAPRCSGSSSKALVLRSTKRCPTSSWTSPIRVICRRWSGAPTGWTPNCWQHWGCGPTCIWRCQRALTSRPSKTSKARRSRCFAAPTVIWCRSTCWQRTA